MSINLGGFRMTQMLGAACAVGVIFGELTAQEEASGFSVNRHSRNDVVRFWHQVYQASEGFENRWEGTLDEVNHTLTASPPEFVADVQRRVNYYRAMAGMSSDISFEEGPIFVKTDDEFIPPAGTTSEQAARAAVAATLSQNYDIAVPNSFVLGHDLSEGFAGFSAAAWNGTQNSNLAVPFWGPEAIDSYMNEVEEGIDLLFNKFVGHRRWILYSGAGGMATADLAPVFEAGGLVRPGMNALYVTGELRQERERKFIAWPSDGFFPKPLNTQLWSLSYPGADFSVASVSMKDGNGNPVSLEVVASSRGVPVSSGPGGPIEQPIPSDNGAAGPGEGVFGDSTIVWTPVITDGFDGDQTFEVTVSGIRGTPSATHVYDVTLIDPNILEVVDLEGSASPPADTGAMYYFGKIEGADEVEFEVGTRNAYTRVEDAEGTPLIIDQTSPSYDLVGTHRFFGGLSYFRGEKSFRIVFKDRDFSPVGFEIDQNFSSKLGAKMQFAYRRGLMTSETQLHVEASSDGGVSWEKVGSSIVGIDDRRDDDFSMANVQLPVSESLRVRFVQSWVPTFTDPAKLSLNKGFFYIDLESPPTFDFGIFIDDISFSQTDVIVRKTIQGINPAEGHGGFSESLLGESLKVGQTYELRARPKVAGFSFAWGPITQVEVIANSPLRDFERWSEFTFPTAGNFLDDSDGDGLEDGLEYALGTSPVLAGDGGAAVRLERDGGRFALSAPSVELVSGVSYQAEWTRDLENWSREGVAIGIVGGRLTASVELDGDSPVYFRWVIEGE